MDELARVAEAAEKLRAAVRDQEQARADFYAAVVAAHEKGLGYRRIAEAARLSFGRVRQIIHEQNP